MRKLPTYLRHALLTVLLTALCCVFSFQQTQAQSISYRAQSLYLYKFTRYVKWPETAFQQDSLMIGVFGNSPIIEELRVMAALKKAAGNRKIIIKQLSRPEEARGMHIVYITSSRSRQLIDIIEQVEGSPTLVVAERGGLARKGASINFMVAENDTVRFEYNQTELEAHKLQVSSDLLRLGYKVK